MRDIQKNINRINCFHIARKNDLDKLEQKFQGIIFKK